MMDEGERQQIIRAFSSRYDDETSTAAEMGNRARELKDELVAAGATDRDLEQTLRQWLTFLVRRVFACAHRLFETVLPSLGAFVCVLPIFCCSSP